MRTFFGGALAVWFAYLCYLMWGDVFYGGAIIHAILSIFFIREVVKAVQNSIKGENN